jgi:RecB family exonuclease
VITPRDARLVRVATLRAFRDAVTTFACEGPPIAARNRMVVVPTRAAAAHLLRTIEDSILGSAGAIMLPEFVTRGELTATLADRLTPGIKRLTEAEREVLLGVAARFTAAAGDEPPFKLRPGLVAEMLRFYDELRWRRNSVDDFERRALDRLEPGADHDRGAARLVRQTRFLAAAYRDFERRAAEAGADEHAMRARLITESSPRPWRHVIVTVNDRAFDPHGLYPVDWDLLTRVPGLQTLDIVITDTALAGAPHERLHSILPGIREIRFGDESRSSTPALLIPEPPARPPIPAGSISVLHVARDREEEVALLARRVKDDARTTGARPSSAALVVQQPLPYVYVAREVLRSAGVPCQLFDTLPLAAEPSSAALDLVFSAVSSNFGRLPLTALLRSPHFDFAGDDSAVSLRDVAALDRALAEGGYLGDLAALERLAASWQEQEPERGMLIRALRAAAPALAIGRELAPLREAATVATHLRVLSAFLGRHERLPIDDREVQARQLRARGAVRGTLLALEQAHARFDDRPVEFDHVAALVRRWIEGQTFQPLTGESGVHVVDAASARYGAFDLVQLAGLVDGEWPGRPRHNIFYTAAVLRDLGWPSEADRLEGARSAFLDLLRLPRERLVLSTFSLEADAIVSPSLLAEEVGGAGLPTIVSGLSAVPIFDFEQLTAEAVDAPADQEEERAAAHPPSGSEAPLQAWSLSALERYQDCPFKFFAADVLRLEEAPEDESTLSPRARGRFIHEVFQRFFEMWDAAGHGTISTDRIDAAREMFRGAAEPLLARLPEADASLERARLFGSAISVGIIDVVLAIEASRPVGVRERLLEYRLAGEFTLGAPDGRRVALKGVADRIDLLDGRRLRVVDYKSGSGPNPRRALQVPIYALCAQERLTERDGRPWEIDEAAYVAFSGKRALIPVVKAGAAPQPVLSDARARVFEVLDGIARAEFPPRPHDPMICRYCAYPSVCRKDYVGDE